MRVSCSPQGDLKHSREVALNQQVKDLIQKLGEAIHESVAESESIAGVVRDIKEQGFDVLLMLEATIGLNEVEEEDESTDADGNQTAIGPFTHNDLTFLKSLRITTEETDSSTDASSGPSGIESQAPPPGDSPGSDPASL